jgi:hypothetical protein
MNGVILNNEEHRKAARGSCSAPVCPLSIFFVYSGMFRFPGILLLLLVAGCTDVPRDNPLDPLSPSYVGDAPLSGLVVLKNVGTPVSSARIVALKDGIAVLSDSSGHFVFPRLSLGDQAVICGKDNFVTDTQRVALVAGATPSLTFSLNGAPVTLMEQILTRKVDQYFPSPQYFVDVSADVTDPNGVADLDSVWFEVSGQQYPLGYNPSTRLFEARVFKYDIPTNTIQWLVGKALHIVSRDLSGAVNISDPFMVTRVIEYGATPASPSPGNNDTTTGTPVLMWAPPSVTFSYTYTLTISRIDAGTPTVVWEVADVNSVNEEYSYPTDGSVEPLAAGNYTWSVTVVDEFGNSCRSKESAFVVQ